MALADEMRAAMVCPLCGHRRFRRGEAPAKAGVAYRTWYRALGGLRIAPKTEAKIRAFIEGLPTVESMTDEAFTHGYDAGYTDRDENVFEDRDTVAVVFERDTQAVTPGE